MKERPIIFSGPMVRALLAGTKTQTRRVLRDQEPIDLGAAMHGSHLSRRPVHDHGKLVGQRMAVVICPYGVPGDRLWVRESFHAGTQNEGRKPSNFLPGSSIWYEADRAQGYAQPGKLWPSIFMPRWACRLVLEVTGTRVERLQNISEADAIAEGVPAAQGLLGDDDLMVHQVMDAHDVAAGRLGAMTAPVARYVLLWDSINDRFPKNWNANPWVWVVEFKRV